MAPGDLALTVRSVSKRNTWGPAAWHAFWRSRPGMLTWKVGVGLAGISIVLVGIALLPLPGPGWLVIIAGLGVLSLEFQWAQRLLTRVKDFLARWTDWVSRQSLAVRGLVGLTGLALACFAVLLSLSISGVPDWAPAWLTSAVALLPW